MFCSMVLCAHLLACTEKKEVNEANLAGVSSLIFTHARLQSTISEYIRLSETDGKAKVYRLVIQQGNGDVSFKLTYVKNYSEVLMHPPTAYFKARGRIVLINSGLETICEPDSTFMRGLEDIILPNLINDVTPDNNGSVRAPILYYAEVWDVEVHKRDSLTVKRNGKAPYVKYLPEEEQIKFEPPTKQ